MGRPKKPEIMDTISARLPKGMLEEIDEYVQDLQKDMPLIMINRADAVRQLLAMGLAARKSSRKGQRK